MNNRDREQLMRVIEFMNGCTTDMVVGDLALEDNIIEEVVETPVLHVVEEEVVLAPWIKSHATGIKREPLERPAYIK